MKNNTQTQEPLGVLIIGAGFGGIGLAIRLDQQGLSDFLILEKASEVGGTWRDNSYPGAACDVPSHLYSFSFEPKADWSSKYAPQAEILAYLKYCVSRYHLTSRIRLGREVQAAEFDASVGLWRVTTTDGQCLTAKALVSACGQLNRPIYPQIAGMDDFSGEAFHSAHWRHDLDLRDQRVAVIGTGASAIQFVPQISPLARQLTLFQRSAAYVISKPDRCYSDRERSLLQRFPSLQRLSRRWQYLSHEVRALAFISFPALMKVLENSFRSHLYKGVKNPDKREQLIPDYPMGCKRMLISNDFYPALDQDHVALNTCAIERITPNGVLTTDGVEHSADVLIYGTGFAATDFLAPMRITGLDGQELNAAWQTGAQAYKGISVHGFPNLFLLYGPNTNLGHSSIIYMLESQFNYVLGCLHALRRQGLRYMDVKAEVQDSFNTHVQQAIGKTIWSRGCNSWYQTADGKHTNNWPGYTFSYRRLTRKPELADYDLAR